MMIFCEKENENENESVARPGILQSFGVPQELHNDMFNLRHIFDRFSFTAPEVVRSKSQRMEALANRLGIPEQAAGQMLHLLERDFPSHQFSSSIKSALSKRKINHHSATEANWVKQGLAELETIVSHAKAMGAQV